MASSCYCGLFYKDVIVYNKLDDDLNCTAKYADKNAVDENGNRLICGEPLGAHPRAPSDKVVRHTQRQFSARFSKVKNAPIVIFKDYDSLMEGFYRLFPKLSIHHSLYFMYQNTPITNDDSLFSLLENLDSHTIIILSDEFLARHAAQIKYLKEEDAAFDLPQGLTDASFEEQTNLVYNELIRRFCCYDTTDTIEMTMREFISPILIGALMMLETSTTISTKEYPVQLIAEKTITGRQAKGPVDYVMSYKSVYIIVGEAKHQNLMGGLYQNLVQQHSLLEVIANAKVDADDADCSLKKRKQAFDLALTEATALGTFGIVSTGLQWMFVRIIKQEPLHENIGYYSSLYYLLNPRSNLAVLKSQINLLLKKIVSIILHQKEIVDNSPFYSSQLLSVLASVNDSYVTQEENEDDES